MPQIIIDSWHQAREVLECRIGVKPRTVTFDVGKKKKPIKAGDPLHIWLKDQGGKKIKVGVHTCRRARFTPGGQRLTIGSTYLRRYYLHQKVKQMGLTLCLDRGLREVNVPPWLVHLALNSPSLKELSNRYGYGVNYLLF